MRYAVIFNPTAGHGAPARKRCALERALEQAGLTYEFFATKRPGHAVELAQEAAGSHDAVVAAGGDGTVQEVARGLLASESEVPLGVLPVGTGNDFLKAIGGPPALAAAARTLAEARPTLVDYGRIRWWEGEEAHQGVFINAVGIGFDAQVAGAVTTFKALRGVAAYLAAALRTLWRWSAPCVQIRHGADGAQHDLYAGPLFLLAVDNGLCSGGGFYLTPDASVADGQLDVCLIEALPTHRVLQLIPRVMRGRHRGAPEVHMQHAQALTVTTDVALPVHADGEVLTQTARCVEIEVVPRGLSVLTLA